MEEQPNSSGELALDDDEIRVLVGLIRLLVGVDMQFSAEESGAVGEIAVEVGEEAFWRHMEASYDEELGADAVWKSVDGVKRTDAQETIYGSLYELSIAGGIEPQEASLLDRLAQVWGLEIEQLDAEGVEEAED